MNQNDPYQQGETYSCSTEGHERDRELWFWLTGMRRHILVFELVVKASRSGEEGISDQLNKTWVEVNLNVC